MEKYLVRAVKKEHYKNLLARGASQADFTHSRNSEFDAVEALTKFEPTIPQTSNKIVSVNKQIAMLERIVTNPLRGNYTACISSFPTDAKAKALAIQVMQTAILTHQKHRKPGRSLPYWHRIFGGLGDPLRDKNIQEVPSLLILSNITVDSSANKLEKVRDLLEKYNNIPRIVVIAGVDPFTFFGAGIHFPLNYGVYLGPPNRVTEI